MSLLWIYGPRSSYYFYFFPDRYTLKCVLLWCIRTNKKPATQYSYGPFYLQCDVCLCWQHAVCMEITQETLPKKYVCYVCANPPGKLHFIAWSNPCYIEPAICNHLLFVARFLCTTRRQLFFSIMLPADLKNWDL